MRDGLSYRGEIDGLRAIAVIVVIVYHAEFLLAGRTILPGGFVGVDIFFVISGYLITRILLRELDATGRIDFRRFYERRARRILPALLVVIVSSFPFAWLYLLPADFKDYLWSLLASLGFVSNLYFAGADADYGAETALLEPFLHTWSLGVEEQFYLIMPVALILLWKHVANRRLAAVATAAAFSFLIAIVMERTAPQLNFYNPLSRFWEMLAGSMLAVVELGRRGSSRPLAGGASWLSVMAPVLGLLMIGFAVAAYSDSATAHPSWPTLLPVVGTVLIIACSHGRDPVGRILSLPVMRGVGLISYSAYLWHYPIFAFGRIRDADPSLVDKSVWIALTVGLSVLTYKLVETPARDWRRLRSGTFLSAIAGSATAVTAFSALGLTTDGFSSRVPEPFREAFDRQPWKALKQDDRVCHRRLDDFCEFNAGASRKLYLVGDSVLGSAMPEIVKRFPDHHIIPITSAACTYAPDTHKLTGDGDIRGDACTIDYQNRIRERLLAETTPSTVVFGGQLGNYLGSERWYRTISGGPITEEGLLRHIRELANNPALTLVYAEPTPYYTRPMFEAALADALGQGLPTLKAFSYSEPRNKATARTDRVRGFLGRLEQEGLAHTVSFTDQFCDRDICYAVRNGIPLVVDRHHLAKPGAELYADRLAESLCKIEPRN